ncbi:unnamed protein product [Choristocarpus tenellus]
MTILGGSAVAAFVSWMAYETGDHFAWHPFLMSVGPLAVSAASIYAIRTRKAISKPKGRIWRVKIHSFLFNLATLMMAGGFYAIYTFKSSKGKEHYTSWHSWLGLAALVLMLASWVTAMLNTVDVQGRRLRWLWFSRNHRWLGIAAYVVSLGAVITGFRSNWGVYKFGRTGTWALTAEVLIVGCGVLLLGIARKKNNQ